MAHTFHKDATRTEIAAILGAKEMALHPDGTMRQAAELPPTRRAVLAAFTGAALAGTVLADVIGGAA